MSCLSDLGYEVEDTNADTCVSVSLCQQYLSYYLFVALALRLLSKTLPLKVRVEVELKLHHIATFKGMTQVQRAQSILYFFAGTCSIYLISHIGARVPSKSSEDTLFWVGAVGALAATVAGALELQQLILVHRRVIKRAPTRLVSGVGSDSSFEGEEEGVKVQERKVSVSEFMQSPFGEVI